MVCYFNKVSVGIFSGTIFNSFLLYKTLSVDVFSGTTSIFHSRKNTMTWFTINFKKAKHPFDSIIVFCFYIVYVFIIKGGYNYLNYNLLPLKFRI